MNRKFLLLITALYLNINMFAQLQQIKVISAPLNSSTSDEFSPVFYKDGIVFCSNRSYNSMVSYKAAKNRVFKLFYAERKDSTGWKYPNLLANEITTDFNEGPVTFNEKGNVMCFTRNNDINNFLKNVSDTANKLGIYVAELINGFWTNIQPFTYTNPEYNLFTPALTSDGTRIYFSSDMPGGIGGMDLYYCDRINNEWAKPINLGPLINTAKDESFPYASKSGRLYFASDDHKGFGGKDIYYSQEIEGNWIAPVHLDSAINSPADDFGLVADSTLENGYFSSNRRKTDDIYSFSSAPLGFDNCDNFKENKFCFTFFDTQHMPFDTVPVIYQWDFGNGIKRIGAEVQQCFRGAGKYSVKLKILDELTGKVVVENVDYTFELESLQQAYIYSYNVGIVNRPILFNGIKSNLKDYLITDYYWNFGDGFKHGSSHINKVFNKKGEYPVQMGLVVKEKNTGSISKICVMKSIRISDTFQEWELKDENIPNQNQTLQVRVYFMDDLTDKQKTIIKESLREYGKYSVKFDNYGIIPGTYSFLDNLSELLKMNSEIRLEIALQVLGDNKQEKKMELSESWAQELTFYLKNKETDDKTFSCKGFGTAYSLLKPFIPANNFVDGVIDLIFLRNE